MLLDLHVGVRKVSQIGLALTDVPVASGLGFVGGGLEVFGA